MTIEEISRKLKDFKNYKSKTIAAEVAGISTETLRKFLNGEFESDTIKKDCIEAIELLERRAAKDREERINKVIKTYQLA